MERRGLTLDGAYDGITFYMQPDWSALKSLDVWAIAAQQIFYTLGISLGNLETISSYCHFNNNCQRDALFIAIANCASSVFAGFAIFSIIGHMAFILEVPVSDVITSGPGLTFIAYPQALAQMPLAPLWSVLFFITLFTLGLDSQFVMAETLVTAICDEFPKFR
ncbi:unnamed protein product [Cyprideis torosa]|uniref:Sodium-dependent nutrient amino acid transporter 1 n=1 Tax=Cyprideis torosa TaxID=163714 RepID=A0A7R8WG75_9CRUS|nr:unnamed protein product [Cyprideis torosa]CAG0897750.1 unnamed protein product [Cyprideis torosa]